MPYPAVALLGTAAMLSARLLGWVVGWVVERVRWWDCFTTRGGGWPWDLVPVGEAGVQTPTVHCNSRHSPMLPHRLAPWLLDQGSSRHLVCDTLLRESKLR
jgi:hypothetical protein